MSTKIEQDKLDAATAAGVGAATGAGVSLLLGGMGLAVGGTAIAIGLPVVAGAGAIVGLAGYGLKKAFGVEDPVAADPATLDPEVEDLHQKVKDLAIELERLKRH